MLAYFAYIRVSTQKQGQKGVSLIEQRDAIVLYAKRENFKIVEWFEERKTAAKRGRPIFARMLKDLRKGRAKGVLLHKIDRSARNLRDWADLGELIDSGVDVRFTTENLDLFTRGGRLSADLQAVVAADYIRNLREETMKGFYGRLKQGLYPMGAPIGYLDKGGGVPKEIDPERAPHLRFAFEEYARGDLSIESVCCALAKQGLLTSAGKVIGKTSLARVLRNPFYMGIIRIQKTGEVFKGIHAPIVSPRLFGCVQDRLDGKTNRRFTRHHYLFRRILKCKKCNRFLVGERQKGHVYYRCHGKGCKAAIREDRASSQIARRFSNITPTGTILREIEDALEYFENHLDDLKQSQLECNKLGLAKARTRYDRLTDALLDGLIEKEVFEQRKIRLMHQIAELESDLEKIKSNDSTISNKFREALELSKSLCSSYILASPEKKREIIEIVSSNSWVQHKYVELEPRNVFQFIEKSVDVPSGAPHRDRVRTFLMQVFESHVRQRGGNAENIELKN